MGSPQYGLPVLAKLRRGGGGGGGGDTSVGKAGDFWSGLCGFDPSSGRLLPTAWVGVSIMNVEAEVIVSSLCLCVAARKIVRHQSWDPRAR